MSSDQNSSDLPINDQAEKSVPKGFATWKEIICDICKIRVPCKKTLEYHEKGRKHQKLLRRKEKKKNKASKHSTKNPCDSIYLPSFIPLSKNCDMPNKKKYNSHSSRNNHSESSNCSNSPNFREPYHRNNRYFGIQDCETDRKSYDKSSWNSKNGKHFSFDRRYNRFNHSFSQPNHLENSHYPNNRAYYLAAPDRSNKHDFSENIQPPEDSGKFRKHPSDNDNSKEVIKISTDEEASPNEKSLNQKVVRRVKLSSEIGEEVSLGTNVTKENFRKESENEKQLEKSKVLTENMTGKRISHWINPSNHKDKAEVRRLVTEFSKSKKKENLIKLKLQTDQNDKALIQNSSLQNTPEEINEQLHDLPVASEIPANENLESNSNIPFINILETKKRQRSKSLTDISTDSIQTSSKNSKETAKKTKKPRRFSTKSSDSNYGKNESLTNSKRKDFVAQSYTSKRHKCSSAECLDQCIDAVVCSEDTSLHLDVLKLVETVPPTVQAVHNDFPSGNQEVYIKKESVEALGTDANILSSWNFDELIQKQNEEMTGTSDTASLSPIDSLINLFATGNITVKKEFDDPLIDAIRSIDPAVLNKVCDGQLTNNYSGLEVVSKPIESCTTNALVVSDSCPVLDSDIPSLTGSLKHILHELQNISAEEEKVKNNLQTAEEKIQYYQTLLDEWRTKKIKFQSEEEILRNKRNTLVKSMNDLVTQEGMKISTESPRPLDALYNCEQPTTNVPKNNSNPNTTSFEKLPVEEDCFQSHKKVTVRKEAKDNVICIDDEISILPRPEDKFPVIDLEQLDPSNSNSEENSSTDSILENCSNLKDLSAHKNAINTLQVYGNYLYTCSNDNTAKRFSLKDSTQTVTYYHEEKIVNQLCVEKIHGKIILFTSTSPSNVITVFNSQDGLKLNVFHVRCNIASMCRGKGKIYVALRAGIILTCDQKEQKELVNISEPIRCIDSTYQGGLNLLLVLSTKGHLSIRDADRSGLLIRFIKPPSHVPLFMTINNDYVYLSSAGYLSVLDISTGKFVKKYELAAAYTSLTVYKDHIFTTSFSGFVRCYSKSQIRDVRAYYGAGKKALTCIHACDDWVFTGNRFGKISVFKFDPEPAFPCQFGKCELVFSLVEDLLYHVLESDHHILPRAGSICPWRKCRVKLQMNWNKEDVCNHIQAHIISSAHTHFSTSSLYSLTS